MASFFTLTACAAGVNSLDTEQANDVTLEQQKNYHRRGIEESYDHATRAFLLSMKNDEEGSAREMEEALSSDPDDFLLRVKYAESLIKLGFLSRAKRHLARALLTEPTAQVAWIALADLYLADEDDPKAVEAANQGIRVETNSPEAMEWLAEYYFSKGDTQHAFELYGRILLHWPDNSAALLGQARTSIALKLPERALHCLEKYLSKGLGDEEAAMKLADLYILSHKTSEVIQLLELMAATKPQNVTIREKLIEILLAEKLNQRAVRHIRSLPAPNTDDTEGLMRRASWLVRADKPYDAWEMIVQYAGNNPKTADVRLLLIQVEIDLNRLEAARLLLEGNEDGWTKEQKAKAKYLRIAAEKPGIF